MSSGRFDCRQPAKGLDADQAPTKRSEHLVDQSISVVQVYSRICPFPATPTMSERSVGRDFMWIMPKDSDVLRQRMSIRNF